ncbi:MAG: hypothetical protein RL318_1055 [Fibrobacterota bacterium]
MILLLSSLAGVSAQELDPSYTLGHIQGLSLQSEGSFDKQKGATIDEIETRLQVGSADVWALNVPMVYHYEKHERKRTTTYSFPGLRLSMHPRTDLIMDGRFGTTNIWGSDTSKATGGRSIRTDLFFHYLSHNGSILLDPMTSPFAYYYGPILNESQLDLSASFNGTWLDNARIRSYGAHLGYGFTPYCQGWVDFRDTLMGSTGESVLDARSLQTSTAGVDWINTPLRMGAQIVHDDEGETPLPSVDRAGDPNSWRVMVYAGVMGWGKRPSVEEALGNWNGFFTPQMPQGQFDLEDSLIIQPRDEGNDLTIRGSARYGALEAATIGLDYNVALSGGEFSELYFTTCLTNIPRRTKGPSEVSNLEYQLGYLPTYGEGRVLLDFLLPGSTLSTNGTADQLMADAMNPYRSSWDRHRRGWVRESEARGSFRARGIVGLNDLLYVTGALSWVNDFTATAGPLSYHLMEAWIFGMGAGVHSESVLFQLSISHYAGKTVENGYDNRVARFGPVQFFASANF